MTPIKTNVKPPSWQLSLQLIRCTICRHGEEINTNYGSAEVSVVHNTVGQSAHRVHGAVLFQEVRVRQREDLDAPLFTSLLHEHLHMPPITASGVPAHIKPCLWPDV